MSKWGTVPLGELCAVTGGGTPTRSNPSFYGGSIPWVTPKDMKSWEISGTQVTLTDSGLATSAAKLIAPNSVLVVVRSGVLKHSLPIALNRVPVAINQDMKALSCDVRLDSGYCARFLKGQAPVILRWVRATTADNFPIEKLLKIDVPLPPLPEQRRIAEILDKADALRAKRRAALAQLDTLTQSIFLDMFGNPATNPKGWPLQTFIRALAAPLRNGLSPSKDGRIIAKVLTLSAVTGGSFDARSLKTSTFRSTPPREQSIHEDDLLVCRGNGNLKLVGKGYFPSQRMVDVTFPDTIIAARINREQIEPTFLQCVWNSPFVRRQVESAARTTNGTFKVNQSMLEAILLLAPPLRLQRDFSFRVAQVENLRSRLGVFSAEADSLFASLQHRAFQGNL